jgi:hypothetical protein
MEILINPSIKAEILKGILGAKKIIKKELGFSKDLIKTEKIEKYEKYILEMEAAITKGFLTV